MGDLGRNTWVTVGVGWGWGGVGWVDGGFLAPAAPTRSRHYWGLRPQTPAVGLNGLVLKRRTG
ncbi:hypothetical protein GCM10017557_67570 [Streptomyces aurantiacus]|uniref:Uncharacterized protein n=1 Tax=Streptomyces aurantiacus TaxID=47760 RepID=A0A7G1P927_9ACTN|nr:hypothetical protein GCM10017557_67570 [Streptomyces aurantiacus]